MAVAIVTGKNLLENFDEDIHDLLKLQLDQAEQRLDKIIRWFWAVTQHQLKSTAQIDDQLKLQRFSIDALDRSEDLLLFAAVTETGQVLPAETVQIIMQCPASDCIQSFVSSNQQIEQSLTSAQNDIIKMVNKSNLSFFEEEVSKLETGRMI